MGIEVSRAVVCRSLEIYSCDAGSPPRSAKRRPAPRSVSLSASIESVLVIAGLRAADQLKRRWPKYSAATYNHFVNVIPSLFGVLAFAAAFNTYGCIFLSAIVALPSAFRLFIAAQSQSFSKARHGGPRLPRTFDENLPIYSIIIPLRSEANMVEQLLSAIEALDYPADKLDVIIAVEEDCHSTRAAITARQHRIPVIVIPVPPGEPRTKPKALSVALPFARGAYTVIYDAEDRPEPNQLRAAIKTFRSTGSDLACVQARLHMDTNTSWHARYFTAEYAGHFDYFLPRLAAFGLPLPLGGSSNHFHTKTLRDVGGWDPYNVTEDADLGMRLARFGYRCGVTDSTTCEEAPANIRRWLAQRSRWFKGWMRLSMNYFFLIFRRF
jgi:cellulose synthase/poly-beta-1,6-N-acetylglucosamine synthase-like glycosyltransferase